MTANSDALLHRWSQTLGRRGDAAAIHATSGAVVRTFASLEEEANRFAEELPAHVQGGQVVGIQLGNHPSWPALLLACLRREAVALPLERSMSGHERNAALAACRASVVATPDAAAGISFEKCSAPAADWHGERPVLLKLTSGTTAAPRAIRFRSSQLLADCDQICETMGITEDDLNFAVVPVSHSYGFSNLITPLLARGVPMVMSSDRMPRAVLEDLVRTKATVFPGMPVFYQAFCDLQSAPTMAHLRLCISAGAPLSLPIAQKFRDKFKLTIHSFYGSSECGGICYDRTANLIEHGFVGEPVSGVDLEMLDDNNGMTRLRVRSAAAGDGYHPLADEAKLGGGCFTPDDLVARRGGGFAIVGRTSDVINVAGKKVNPAEVEATLLAFDGVREAAVFGLHSSLRNEEVAACIVATKRISDSDLLEFCRRRLSGWQVPKRLFFLDAMPVNDRGKISRRTLAQRFTR